MQLCLRSENNTTQAKSRLYGVKSYDCFDAFQAYYGVVALKVCVHGTIFLHITVAYVPCLQGSIFHTGYPACLKFSEQFCFESVSMGFTSALARLEQALSFPIDARRSRMPFNRYDPRHTKKVTRTFSNYSSSVAFELFLLFVRSTYKLFFFLYA